MVWCTSFVGLLQGLSSSHKVLRLYIIHSPMQVLLLLLLLLLLSRFSRVWLCDHTDCSTPGSAIPGIFQARTLEWVAISFSNAGKWKVKVKSLSHVQLSATPWTAAHQAPPSMGFPRQDYWSEVPLPSPSLWAIGSIIVSIIWARYNSPKCVFYS